MPERTLAGPRKRLDRDPLPVVDESAEPVPQRGQGRGRAAGAGEIREVSLENIFDGPTVRDQRALGSLDPSAGLRLGGEGLRLAPALEIAKPHLESGVVRKEIGAANQEITTSTVNHTGWLCNRSGGYD